MEELVVFNIIYFLFSFFLIYPPTELQLLGFSIPTLFSSYLGSEQLCFIHYHIIRICLTIQIHSLLPLGYYLFMALSMPDLNLFNISELSIIWKIYLMFSVLFAAGLLTLIFYWKMNEYSNHPIVAKLKTLSQTNNWKQLAN